MPAVTCRTEARTYRITLDAPAAGNPLDHEVADALLEAFQQADTARAQVIVLDALGWAFCVGGNLKAFAAMPDPGSYVAGLAERLHRVIRAIHTVDAVVVTVVQGVAAGAGFPLALAGDLVLATRDASFVLGYTAAGLTPDGGASGLVHAVGLPRAMSLALRNPRLSADDAARLGLVSDVVDDPSEVEAVVAQLLEGSASAQASTKRLMRAAQGDPAQLLDREATAVATAAATTDGLEGIAAFVNRRQPCFNQQRTAGATT